DGHAARLRRGAGRFGRGAKRVDGGDCVVGQSARRGGGPAHRGGEVIPIVGGRSDGATRTAGGGLGRAKAVRGLGGARFENLLHEIVDSALHALAGRVGHAKLDVLWLLRKHREVRIEFLSRTVPQFHADSEPVD